MSARYTVTTGKVSTGALTTGSVKSMWLLNPATDGITLTEILISFGAVASQSDIAVELYRTNTLGSPAGTSATVNKDDPSFSASTVTGLTALSTEPTSVFVLRELYVPVNQGFFAYQFPLGREPIAGAAGSRIGLRIVNDEAGTITAVNCRSTAAFEEQ